MTKFLLIVESPAKAKTLKKYLGSDFDVLASYGHIRDIPSKNGAVDTENDFQMKWAMTSSGSQHLKSIIQACSHAQKIFLASDPDREGEAIAWHILKELEKKKIHIPYERITFHEITRQAVQEAMASPGALNEKLVDAYLARRALDYLVGFTVSPILWRKLPKAKSAGRVQSVALKLICDRETEIEDFISEEYWSITGHFLTPNQEPFEASLEEYEGKKIKKLSLRTQQETELCVEELRKHVFSVVSQETNETKRHPNPPFTTSTLQQEANNKLGFSSSLTMQLAQKLYEGIKVGSELEGLITYMRTDSTSLSQVCISQVREFLEKNLGPSYVPESARIYKTKTKNAQEAHEAIRPTNIFYTPEKLKAYLTPQQLDLYTLIWKRTLASQATSAILIKKTVLLGSKNQQHLFKCTGSVVKFDGFLYFNASTTKETLLPFFNDKEIMTLHDIVQSQHFTQGPSRYSEATLIKKLEEIGVGRPSTYASIIRVLQERNYASMNKTKFFIPNMYGRLLSEFLQLFYGKYFKDDFTASMEEFLDQISRGEVSKTQILDDFWQDFAKKSKEIEEMSPILIRESIDQSLGEHFFQLRASLNNQPNARQCPQCAEGRLSLNFGKHGAFISCSDYPTCRYIASLDESEATANPDHCLGLYEEQEVLLRKGPYGPYLQLGRETDSAQKIKRVTLPPEEKEATLSLERAISWLSLPRTLGSYEDKPIIAHIGRFGPYIKYEDDYVSLKNSELLFTLSAEEASTLIHEKIQKKNNNTRLLGIHPTQKKEIRIQNKGRYAPYLFCGNIKVYMNDSINADTLSLEEGITLINQSLEKKKKKKTPSKNKRNS